MKIKIILVQAMLFAAIIAYGQPVTVYTCKNGTVAANVLAEFSPAQITAANNQTMTQYGYLGITFLDNSSNQYNCHSYAWHLREGNANKVWINNATQQTGSCFDQTNNIARYWTDGCFIKVCNEADADKVHYYCGDHSAVRSTTNPGFFESKWGQLAVVRHTRTGVPYSDPVNSVNYYASTAITGSLSALCSGTRTFSVKNIPGCTYSWTKSSGLSAVGTSNTSTFTVQPSGAANGDNWVEVQITSPCSGTPAVRRASFSAGAPPTPTYIDYSIDPVVACNEVRVSTNYIPGATYTWSYFKQPYSGNLVQFPNSPSSRKLTLTQGSGIYNIGVTATNACGTSNIFFISVPVNCDQGGGHKITVSPNPAKGNFSITFTEQTRTKELFFKSQGKPLQSIRSVKSGGKTVISLFEYNTNMLVRQWTKNEVSGKNYSFNIAGLRTGLYLLQVDRDNETTSEKLIIE
jgi:Secretion system C-terminal sorting domain/PKD-like domain